MYFTNGSLSNLGGRTELLFGIARLLDALPLLCAMVGRSCDTIGLVSGTGGANRRMGRPARSRVLVEVGNVSVTVGGVLTYGGN